MCIRLEPEFGPVELQTIGVFESLRKTLAKAGFGAGQDASGAERYKIGFTPTGSIPRRPGRMHCSQRWVCLVTYCILDERHQDARDSEFSGLRKSSLGYHDTPCQIASESDSIFPTWGPPWLSPWSDPSLRRDCRMKRANYFTKFVLHCAACALMLAFSRSPASAKQQQVDDAQQSETEYLNAIGP